MQMNRLARVRLAKRTFTSCLDRVLGPVPKPTENDQNPRPVQRRSSSLPTPRATAVEGHRAFRMGCLQRRQPVRGLGATHPRCQQ